MQLKIIVENIPFFFFLYSIPKSWGLAKETITCVAACSACGSIKPIIVLLHTSLPFINFESTLYSPAYLCLYHVAAIIAHIFDHLEDVDLFLLLHAIHENVQGDERPSSAHSSTEAENKS